MQFGAAALAGYGEDVGCIQARAGHDPDAVGGLGDQLPQRLPAGQCAGGATGGSAGIRKKSAESILSL